MKVIVESGATKADWRLIHPDGKEAGRFLTEGMNISTIPLEVLTDLIGKTGRLVTEAAGFPISSIHFYAAGVTDAQSRKKLRDIVQYAFPEAEIEIQDDLTAAARAAYGHRPGIVAILGTGSNSCQFDGEKIVRRAYSGGFILGDEGSAATLGRLFIADFIKGLVPAHISETFAERHDSSYGSIISKVYRSDSPSAYLGSLAPFIMEFRTDPYIKELVEGNFRNFFRRCIRSYDYESYPIGIIGGFGNALKDTVIRIAEEEGMKISGFIPSPIEELKKYHIEQKQ